MLDPEAESASSPCLLEYRLYSSKPMSRSRRITTTATATNVPATFPVESQNEFEFALLELLSVALSVEVSVGVDGKVEMYCVDTISVRSVPLTVVTE